MVVATTVAVVCVVAPLSAFVQLGIKAQPTVDFSSEDHDSCSQLDEGCEAETAENKLLRTALESNQQKMEALEKEICRLRARELKSVRATFKGRLGITSSPRGMTKVEDRIYVLGDTPGIDTINVFEDGNEFRFVQEIALNGTGYLVDIVYSSKSKLIYISDSNANCIWVMATKGEHNLTKWLTGVTGPHRLSFSTEGHLLVLSGLPTRHLEIYSLNAKLIRRILLPEDITVAVHVVQTSAGNFILLHRLKYKWNYKYIWTVSQLTNDGLLIRSSIPRNQSEELNDHTHMSLDSDNNLLFVADTSNNRVILFDAMDLTWSQVLLSKDRHGIRQPWRLFYDAENRQLFVAQHYANVTVFEIN